MPYATSTHHCRDPASACGHCVALAVEIAPRKTAGRHHHRAGEFQALLSPDYRPAGILVAVAAALVVVAEMISGFEEDT